MVNIRGQPYGFGGDCGRSEYTSPVKSQGRVSVAFNKGIFSAHMGAEPDAFDDAPSTAKLMEKFTHMYQEIEVRLERGISHAKEATLESKLRASSNSALIGAGAMNNDYTCEILDLKAEMTSLKNKMFQAEQKKIEEVNKRQAQISQLEQKLREAETKQRDLATSKEQKINELEKDIETFVKKYADENDLLKKENETLKQQSCQTGRSTTDIKEFKMQTAAKID